MKRPVEVPWNTPAGLTQRNGGPMRKAKSFSHIGNHAINVLARLAAKRAMQEELRAQGVRVSLVKPAEVSARAQVYLSQHPELWREAVERAQRLGMFEKRRKRTATEPLV